jgi:hypothetical protein
MCGSPSSVVITAAIGASRVPRPLHSGQRSFGNCADLPGRLSVTSHTVPADRSYAVFHQHTSVEFADSALMTYARVAPTIQPVPSHVGQRFA